MTGPQHNPYSNGPQGSQNHQTPQPQTQSFGEYQTAVAEKPQKKKRGWLKWGIGIAAVVVLFNVFTGNDNDDTTNTANTADSATAADSEDAPNFVAEAEADTMQVAEEDAAPVDEGVSTEFKNALRSAERYLDFSSFSYQGLYDQLTSEYADAYPAEAAQYALDNIEVDWNAEALESAETYLDFSHFSYAGLYGQLTSEYGEEFTAEQAQYAVDTVDADWNAEAIEAAESYQEMMPMSGSELLDQLTSEYGEEFTYEQAQQAVTAVGL